MGFSSARPAPARRCWRSPGTGRPCVASLLCPLRGHPAHRSRPRATILPPLSFEEALEYTKIHSTSGLLTANAVLVTTRPFRSPHRSVSNAGLIGGGSIPKPGEMSLAHHGVAFMDSWTGYCHR